MVGVQQDLEAFRFKLSFFVRQSVAHLSWMGLFREDADQHLAKFSPKPGAPLLSMEEEHQLVHTKFLNMR